MSYWLCIMENIGRFSSGMFAQKRLIWNKTCDNLCIQEPYMTPLRASYEVFILRICEKFGCGITVPHYVIVCCICRSHEQLPSSYKSRTESELKVKHNLASDTMSEILMKQEHHCEYWEVFLKTQYFFLDGHRFEFIMSTTKKQIWLFWIPIDKPFLEIFLNILSSEFDVIGIAW